MPVGRRSRTRTDGFRARVAGRPAPGGPPPGRPPVFDPCRGGGAAGLRGATAQRGAGHHGRPRRTRPVRGRRWRQRQRDRLGQSVRPVPVYGYSATQLVLAGLPDARSASVPPHRGRPGSDGATHVAIPSAGEHGPAGAASAVSGDRELERSAGWPAPAARGAAARWNLFLPRQAAFAAVQKTVASRSAGRVGLGVRRCPAGPRSATTDRSRHRKAPLRPDALRRRGVAHTAPLGECCDQLQTTAALVRVCCASSGFHRRPRRSGSCCAGAEGALFLAHAVRRFPPARWRWPPPSSSARRGPRPEAAAGFADGRVRTPGGPRGAARRSSGRRRARGHARRWPLRLPKALVPDSAGSGTTRRTCRRSSFSGAHHSPLSTGWG